MFKALKTINSINSVTLLSTIAFVVIAALISLGPITKVATYAQVTPSLPPIFGDPIVADQDSLIKMIVNIAQTIIFVFAGVCVLIIIWGGIKWGISKDENGVTGAKKIIQNGITGLVIAALSFLIMRIIFGIIQFILDFFNNNS